MQRCGYLFQAKYYFCIDTKYWNIRGSVLVCWGQKFGFSDVCSLLALITHHLRSPLCSGSQWASMTLTESVMWVAVSWMRVCRFRIWQLSWVIRKKYPLTERLRKGCCFVFFFFTLLKSWNSFSQIWPVWRQFPSSSALPRSHAFHCRLAKWWFGLAEASSWVQGDLAVSGCVTDTGFNSIYVTLFFLFVIIQNAVWVSGRGFWKGEECY